MSDFRVAKQRERIDELTAQRDAWIRLYMRLEVAVSHHQRDTGEFATDADERLWAARDRITSDSAKGA